MIDVDVIVPVYNTMPYLTECLRSLAEQTIGHDRMHVIAVDDGSTDGSGQELDRFARRYPGLFTVIHQANSGGPAGPCNRALDVATGRYVFFIGADDYLGRESLQRQVAAADDWGSDVLLGKVVGVNSRYIEQDIFARNAPDIDFLDSPLPRSLANTKLFRRELLERHGIRYPEDLPIGSDMPFTLEACYRAKRVSVLADYDHYFAVRRFSATNITYLSRHALRLRTVEKMLAFLADLIEPGPQRDVMLVRYFEHEITKLIEDDFLRLDRDTQQLVHDGVGRLTAGYLTDAVAERLPVQTRIRTAVARDGDLDDLLAVIRQDAEVGVPDTIVHNGRLLSAYPGMGRLPDACFDVTTAPDWRFKLDATGWRWERGVLTLAARSPHADLGPLTVSAQGVPAETQVSGHAIRIRFRARDLLAASDVSGQRRTVVTQGISPVRAPGLSGTVPLLRRKGARLYVITPVRDTSGYVMISVVPVTPRRVLARLLRRRTAAP
jgi:poly(ribitol-phosphate) beta-N-acetylglucosaminyltransferase